VSVITAVTVALRPFSGYRDPRFPLGIWRGVESSIGDASGGFNEVDIRFQFTEGARSSLFFSLEQLMITNTESAQREARLFTLNMDRVDPTTLPTPAWTVLLKATIVGAAAALLDRGSLFLGSPSDPNATAILGVQMTNVLNAIMHINVQGYYWGPRSVLQDGGLQKPPQGLFA